MDNTLTFENHGAILTASNYWDSEMAQKGIICFTINAGCIRMLLPPRHGKYGVEIPAMQLAREIVISRGPWPEEGKEEALEIMFDDHSDTPYVIHSGPEQWVLLPQPGEEWTFIVYQGRGKRKPHSIFYKPAHVRMAPKIPWMKPLETAGKGEEKLSE